MDDQYVPRKRFDDFDDSNRSLDRSSESRVLTVILFLAAGFFLCSLVGVGIFVFMAFQDDFGLGKFRSVPMPAVETESLEEKQAAVKAAFDADEIGVDEATLGTIQDLFDAVIEACEKNDESAVVKTIDYERQLLQIKKTGIIKEMIGLEESMLRNYLKRDVNYQLIWRRYNLVHVDPARSETEKIVYAFFWDTSGSSWPIRWWIVQQQGAWKIFDWELMHYGMRESTTQALYFQYTEDPRLDRYYDAVNGIDTADTLRAQGDYKGAMEKIRLAESQAVLPQLADELQLRIAYAWSRGGRNRQLIKACKRIKSPQAVPGAFYGQAMGNRQLGHHQKVLDFSEKYESVAGSDLDLLSMKADSLSDLGRTDDAVLAWRKILKYDPENLQVLQSFGLALEDDRKHLLVEYLENVKEPVKTAVSLVSTFSAYDDTKSAEMLIGFIEKTAPGSSQLESALGQVDSSRMEYEAAAAHFKAAFTKEQDEEQRRSYVYRYLDMMSFAEKVVEGYENAPDPSEAFQYYADVNEEGDSDLSTESFRSLLEAHRKKKPDDPWLKYHSAVLLSVDGKFDEAEQELSSAITAIKQEKREESEEGEEEKEVNISLRYQLISVLFQDGRGLEAYEKIEPAKETFQSLADMYRYSDRLQEFQKLVEMHRKNTPDDERLDLYSGIIQLEKKNYDEAQKLFARGYKKTSDEEYLKYEFRSNWIESYIKSGDPLAAYRNVDKPKVTFTFLANRLAQKKDWPTLKTLIQLHKDDHPDDPKLIVWEADMYWQQKDYEGVVRLLAPWSEKITESLANWELSQIADKLFRSTLRLNRIDDAVRFAETRFEEEGKTQMLIFAHAAAGNTEKVAEYLQEYNRSMGGSLSSVYSDKDVGHILSSDKYLPLRRKYPPSKPYDTSRMFAVLLLKEPLSADKDRIRAELVPVLGEELILTALPQESGAKPPKSYLLQTGGERFYLTFGSDRYFGEHDVSPNRSRSDQLRQALDDHTGWLAVSDVKPLDWKDHSRLGPACRAISPFADENTLALYISTQSKFITNETEIAIVLRADTPEKDIEDIGETDWMYRNSPLEKDEQKTLQAVRRRLKVFRNAFADKKPEQEFFVQISLKSGFAEEQFWIPVTRIDRGDYGRKSFIGELPTDSVLFPALKAGEPIRLQKHEILDWKYTNGKKTVQGRSK